MKNLYSFGSEHHYAGLIALVKDDKHLWRKVANIINNARRNMKEWTFVDKELQFAAAQEYVDQAINDTKLPDNVKNFLMLGLSYEFGFAFEWPEGFLESLPDEGQTIA